MEIVVLFIVALAGASLGWQYFKKHQPQTNLPADQTVRLRGSGRYDFTVVGVSHYRGALEQIYGRVQYNPDGKQVDAVLVLEDNNSDIKAVRVDIQGRTVGYLPKDLAREYRRRMEENSYLKVRSVCRAKITSRMRNKVWTSDFAVRLDLPQKQSNTNESLRHTSLKS